MSLSLLPEILITAGSESRQVRANQRSPPKLPTLSAWWMCGSAAAAAEPKRSSGSRYSRRAKQRQSGLLQSASASGSSGSGSWRWWIGVCAAVVVVVGLSAVGDSERAAQVAAGEAAAAQRDRMGNKASRSFEPPVVIGAESLMSKKAHGTCSRGVQDNLRWACDPKLADRICCFNRHYAEHSGYFHTSKVTWLKEVDREGETNYYDSIHGKRVFVGPRGRSFDEFLKESRAHGWPSFRDDEVDWENVRILPNGEAVTVDGVHLGHNIPDASGNRYCINLVCIAAQGP